MVHLDSVYTISTSKAKNLRPLKNAFCVNKVNYVWLDVKEINSMLELHFSKIVIDHCKSSLFYKYTFGAFLNAKSADQ